MQIRENAAVFRWFGYRSYRFLQFRMALLDALMGSADGDDKTGKVVSGIISGISRRDITVRYLSDDTVHFFTKIIIV